MKLDTVEAERLKEKVAPTKKLVRDAGFEQKRQNLGWRLVPKYASRQRIDYIPGADIKTVNLAGLPNRDVHGDGIKIL
jgi:hypothetical protein